MTPIGQTIPEHLQEVILRFLEGTASDEDVHILTEWLKEDKRHREYFDEFNTTFQASVTLNRFTQQRTDDAWGDLFHQLGDVQDTKIRRLSMFAWIARVAATVAILAAGWFALHKINPQDALQQQSSLVKNVPGNNTRILLPDSSIVWLNANSTLEYPPAFGTTSREVVLKGEAFFDIRKGKKPFIVKTDGVQVQVKGTKFNVQAYKNDHTIKTTLQEGQVELKVTAKNEVYTMAPGDQVILNTDRNDVTIQKVNPSNFTAWKEESLVFDNTPLHEVISKLENRFRVNIALDGAVSADERLTMTIERENLDEVLDLIQLSSRLKVKKETDKDFLLYP